jgi:hypothetical protein
VNLFQKARSWLPAMEQKAAGETVTYTRGAESITLAAAVVGRTVFASNEEGAARISFGDRDYLIGVADLTFGAPRIGDRVTQTIDGADVVFEIKDLDTGEPPWRFSDPDRTTWRVHVKRVL